MSDLYPKFTGDGQGDAQKQFYILNHNFKTALNELFAFYSINLNSSIWKKNHRNLEELERKIVTILSP